MFHRHPRAFAVTGFMVVMAAVCVHIDTWTLERTLLFDICLLPTCAALCGRRHGWLYGLAANTFYLAWWFDYVIPRNPHTTTNLLSIALACYGIPLTWPLVGMLIGLLIDGFRWFNHNLNREEELHVNPKFQNSEERSDF